MPSNIDQDDIINDAINELIDDDTAGFYLVATKEDGRLVAVHDDRPERLVINDELAVNSNTLKLYYHFRDQWEKIEEEYDDSVQIEELLVTLLNIHAAVDIDTAGIYEVKE